MKAISKLFIRFYQKYLTVLSYGSCRYYPTCSQYALWQLDNNSFFKAIFYTIIRILKCNQLFDGGFDYPVINRLKNNQNINLENALINKFFVDQESQLWLCTDDGLLL